MAFPALDLWMNGEYVGVWFWTRGGVPVLRYDPAWLRSPQVRPLSLSLPIPAGGNELRGPTVEHYFDNLLPDSTRIRERLRRRFRIAGGSAAELLAAIGRDCVGALQLMPAGEVPPPFDRVETQALTEMSDDRESEKWAVDFKRLFHLLCHRRWFCCHLK